MIRFLKEWEAVERALEDGRQIFIARKGGILDEDGLFTRPFLEFYLYPTFLHQSEEAGEIPKPPPKEVSIRLFCHVVETRHITDSTQLKLLDAEHVWEDGFLEKRFEWGSEKGITLLVVRAYAVEPARTIAVKPSYAGCKSWIEDESLELTGTLRPTLSEEAFQDKLSRFKKALGE